MKVIRHEQETVNGLQKSVYVYWFNDSRLKLQLDKYEEYTRRTTRHKWVLDGQWDRGNEPHHKHHNSIRREDISFLHDVGAIVLKQLVEQITVETE